MDDSFKKIAMHGMKITFLVTIPFFILIPVLYCRADDGKGIQRIVFEEFQIEGKIRRPQLVLIKAEQRPKFTPMVMQSLDSTVNVMKFAKDPVVENSPYSGAFRFDKTGISNYKP